ncbi:hypothetical protein SVIOM342S_04218 [Streptomyces violaceorubidus]
MHGIFGLFGEGLLALRLPSVLAMSVAASGVGLLGLRLAGPRAGLLAWSVFPVLPQVQKYAQEGRSYAMVCALVAWATYALVVSVPQRARWRWAVYGSTMLLACLLHEFAVLALVAHGVTLAVCRVPQPVLRAWGSVAAAGVVALAVAPGDPQRGAVGAGGLDRRTGAASVLPGGGGRRHGVCPGAPGGRGPVRLSALAVPLLVLPGLLLLIASLVKPLFDDRGVQQCRIRLAAGRRDGLRAPAAALLALRVDRGGRRAGRCPAESFTEDAPEPKRRRHGHRQRRTRGRPSRRRSALSLRPAPAPDRRTPRTPAP